MAGLKRPVPTGPDRKATRPLRPYELRAVWTGIDQCQPRDKSRMIKLALLLGRRRTEIAAAEIEELHLDETEPHWLIKPREGNKSSIDSLVPLPPAALKIIREAVADACNSRYLFPAPKNLQKPTVPDSLSLAWRRLCNSVGVPDDVDLHGARDLITDSLLPMGTPSLVISYVLHHSSDMKSTVALKNYRTFEFRAEKLRALRLWQARLHNIVSARKLRVLRW